MTSFLQCAFYVLLNHASTIHDNLDSFITLSAAGMPASFHKDCTFCINHCHRSSLRIRKSAFYIALPSMEAYCFIIWGYSDLISQYIVSDLYCILLWLFFHISSFHINTSLTFVYDRIFVKCPVQSASPIWWPAIISSPSSAIVLATFRILW